MFLIDKYKPSSPESIFFHKNLFELLNVMSKDEAIPHIIFYGAEGSGKKTIIKLFLEMLFDKSVHKTRDVIYMVTGSGNKTTKEKVKQSNYHIVIDPKNNNFDRYLIHDIVKEYAKRRTLGAFKTSRAFKVVMINNLDNMSYYAQTSLRRTMERYNDKCRFVMWCNSLSKVIEPLQSRCICLRIPCPSDDELFQYIFKISIKERIFLELDQYAKIIKNSNGNIKKALWELDFHRFKYDMDTDYCDSLNKIVELILEIDLSNMIPIRNIIFNLMITNFDGTTIMSDLVDTLCTCKKISDDSKQKIVFASAEIEYQLVKGRREIIQFDALITSVMKIISDEKNKKQLASS
jgi:replication factor C subunit 3/5